MGDPIEHLIEQHYLETWARLGTAGGGRLVETSELRYTLGAINHVPYNHVLRCDTAEDRVEDLVEELLSELGDRDAVWSITSTSRPERLPDVLTAHGCTPFTTLTGMSLEISEPIDAKIADGCEIVEVGPDQMDAYLDLVLDQWHLSAQERQQLWTMHRELGFDEVRRWIMFADGAPVAKVSAGFYVPGSVGIYGVSTRPQARGRGAATALTSAVLRTAREAGARTAVLQSTPMAAGIYERLGFAARCSIDVYAVPRSTSLGERISRT